MESGADRRALDYKLAGASYQRIAEALGLPDEASAIQAVMDGLEAVVRAPVAAHQLDHERLDALILAQWAAAKAGDRSAIDRILRIVSQRERLRRGDESDEATVLERLPEWVPTYLAAWGSTGPDGKKMTVKAAAELAGTNDSNVRNLRTRSPQFRRLEDMARHGSAERAASQVDAYLRGNSLRIIEAFDALVGQGNPQTVLKAMEWLRDRPAEVDVNLRGAVATVQGQMSDEDAEQILNNLLLAELAEAGAGSGAPPAATGAGGKAGSADLDDPA